MNYMPQNFKTSHVIVYLFYPGYRHLISGISKHLMLLFIFSPSALSTGNTLFQNISCYCLSALKMADKTIEKHFKTSHVIVYLQIGNATIRVHEFQNISCYCLSLAFPRFLVSPLPFFPLYFLYFSIFYQPTPLS